MNGVDRRLITVQNEHGPRVGSAEAAEMNRSALEAKSENQRISLSRFSHKAAWVVNRRLVA